MWKRPLGEGYSSPSVEGSALYTMYGRTGQEIVTPLDARTGKTLGALHAHVIPQQRAGDGQRRPYATALLVGDRVFTTGVSGRMPCLDKTTGKPPWTQMLWDDHGGGTRLMYGYTSSPIAFSRHRHRAGRRQN